jgi:DNA invertase Pin-like site-specific DNA recombinase
MRQSVIYARVSSMGSRQNTERQVRDLQAYADHEGYEVSKVFEEHISGAKRNQDRPILCECMEYCITNHIGILLISELSRLGRKVDEVLENVKYCKDHHLNIYFQKENLAIFNPDGSENPFLTIMIAVLGTCAQLEREAIYYRLQSGREKYIADGGKVGRKVGYRKPMETKEEEYREVIRHLKKGTTIRDTAKLTGHCIRTVQRIKKEFGIQKPTKSSEL